MQGNRRVAGFLKGDASCDRISNERQFALDFENSLRDDDSLVKNVGDGTKMKDQMQRKISEFEQRRTGVST